MAAPRQAPITEHPRLRLECSLLRWSPRPRGRAQAFLQPVAPSPRSRTLAFPLAQLRVLCPAMEARRSSSDPCDLAPASGLGLLALPAANQDNTPRQRLVWLAGGNIGEFRIN